MTIVLILAAFLAGTMFGAAAISYEEECPRTVLGHNCRGEDCDHTKSELYRAKMVMAQHHERYEAQE